MTTNITDPSAAAAPVPAPAPAASPAQVELLQAEADDFARVFNAARAEIGQVIVGQDRVVEASLTAIFCGGNVLLEGVPGLGKTELVKALSRVLELDFRRIQFTPDQMPKAATSSSSAPARSSRNSCWPTRSTGPRPRRSRPSWRRCRKAR